MQELLSETLWPNQPLGRSLTGTLQSLDAISRRKIVAYKRDCYTAANTIVGTPTSAPRKSTSGDLTDLVVRCECGLSKALSAATKLAAAVVDPPAQAVPLDQLHRDLA